MDRAYYHRKPLRGSFVFWNVGNGNAIDGQAGFEIDERFVYARDELALVFDAAGTLTNRYLSADAVDAALAEDDFSTSGTANATEWLLADHQGSVRDIVRYAGASSAEVTHIVYDSFGNITGVTGSMPVAPRLGYTGQERDSETGLMYYDARYYDPKTGRFISQDPTGFGAGDSNLYRYVMNSPVIYVDPTGLRLFSPVQQMFNGVSNAVGNAINSFGSAANVIGNWLAPARDAITNSWAATERRMAVTNALGGIGRGLQTIGSAIGNQITNIGNSFTNLGNAVGQVVSPVGQAISNSFSATRQNQSANTPSGSAAPFGSSAPVPTNTWRELGSIYTTNMGIQLSAASETFVGRAGGVLDSVSNAIFHPIDTGIGLVNSSISAVGAAKDAVVSAAKDPVGTARAVGNAAVHYVDSVTSDPKASGQLVGDIAFTGVTVAAGGAARTLAGGLFPAAPSVTAVRGVADELSDAARRASLKVGPGKGPVHGTKVHTAYKAEVNTLGNPGVFTEQSYLNGLPVKYGTPGSIRIDTGVGTVNAPSAVYDLKTGNAKLTQARIQRIQAHVPGGTSVPVYEVRP